VCRRGDSRQHAAPPPPMTAQRCCYRRHYRRRHYYHRHYHHYRRRRRRHHYRHHHHRHLLSQLRCPETPGCGRQPWRPCEGSAAAARSDTSTNAGMVGTAGTRQPPTVLAQCTHRGVVVLQLRQQPAEVQRRRGSVHAVVHMSRPRLNCLNGRRGVARRDRAPGASVCMTHGMVCHMAVHTRVHEKTRIRMHTYSV
jgi:hypothetical protein